MSKLRSSKSKKSSPKYIFVVGGVMSGVGKGITTSSMALILQSRGFNVTAVKIDPYVNVDAGTMNPLEHGETFVLSDGLECDQDMGNYERFLNTKLSRTNYMTTGSVYQSVIEQERSLRFGGKCVSVVPHIPNEVTERIKQAQKANDADITIIEIGGTAGEYENLLFLEAARLMKLESPKDVLFVLVSYLPIPSKIGEMKTKPTQHASRLLNSAGIQADMIVARSSHSLDDVRKQKLSVMCNIAVDDVISAPDVESIYHVPINFEIDNLSTKILKKLDLRPRKKDLKDWTAFTQKINTSNKEVRIGIVGKYFNSGDFVLSDAYISVIEAIKHASYFYKLKPVIDWIDSSEFESDSKKLAHLKQYAGILIPGGFGERGVEGKLKAIQYARENKVPYLGLCYGMQLAVIEFARNVAKIKDANTTEIEPSTVNPVIDIMEGQDINIEQSSMGGTMRLGEYICDIKPKTIARKLYGAAQILERHRHRYEFNNQYRDVLEQAGLVISGINPDNDLVEIIELKSHPFFVATQFHPELISRPLTPHPLFKGFIRACQKNSL
ncbi:MAG: synthetase, synthase [Candidatus Parcubacteria bacterium]|jgi:CTP synthase